MGLRFLNVLLLGCVVIFFVNRRMVRAEKKGTMPTAARSGILRSLLWQFTGLALVGASFGSQGELFRGLLVLGSILVIGGEMTLAWGMRCFILDKKMGLTPLWPMYLASSLGILISYPNLPGGILSLSWIAVGLVSLYILKELHARELPGIENNLLHVHRLTVWLSMAVAAIGWPRMAILVLITRRLPRHQHAVHLGATPRSSTDLGRAGDQWAARPALLSCSRDSSRPSSRPSCCCSSCAAWCSGSSPCPAARCSCGALGAGVRSGPASFNVVRHVSYHRRVLL